MKLKKQSKLGKVICIRLVELNKNKKWLAETTGMAPCLITRYCLGESIPTAISIAKISRALGISVEKLIEIIEEEENSKAV